MKSNLESHIQACETRLYEAMLTSNVAELDVLISDELLFVGPTGELATKAMDLELHRSGGTTFHELLPKELEIRVCSDECAIVTAKVFLRGTYLGNDFAGEFRYLRVWKLSANGWQIAGGSVSPIA